MTTQTQTVPDLDLGPSPPEPGLASEALRQRLAERLFGQECKQVCIGRFEVIELLGSGGMGVVYLARDPKLDRRVALKLLQPELIERQGRERMVREALALARLSHPNVVHVYEVSEHEEAVFLAMEYVEGVSLRQWGEVDNRTWQQVVALHLDAGKGLAAAHAAGVVHRDFKPANVLVGVDGRARVADFGLACGAGVLPEHASLDHGGAEDGSTGGRSGELTSPGVRLGTPAYMSPEQITGAAVDPRSDQFSYCVAFWEALFGQRPYAVEDVRKAARGKGDLGPPSGARSGVPRWLRKYLARGLALDPAARWPDMATLLEEMQAAPVRRRRWVMAAAVTLLFGVASARTFLGDDDACVQPSTVELPWDGGLRDRVVAAAREEGTAFAHDAATRAIEAFARHAAAWEDVRRQTCEATMVARTQSNEQLDLSMGCLDRLRKRTRWTAELLASEAAFERAEELLAELPSPETCADPVELRRVAAPAPELAEAVADTHDAIAHAWASLGVGVYQEGLAVAVEAVDAARRTEHGPTIAEALLVEGALRYGLEQHEAAHGCLMEAVNVAEASRHDEVAADAWRRLVETATQREDFDHAREWVDRSRAAVDRLGAPAVRLAAHLDAEGLLASFIGEPISAIEVHSRAAEALRSELPDDDARVARNAMRLANALAAAGQLDAAIATYTETLERRRPRLGPLHPELASLHFDIGYAELERGDLEKARAHLEKALEIQRAAHGDDSPASARTTAALGLVGLADDRFDDAVSMGLAAWNIARSVLPVGHAERVAGLSVTVNALLAKGALAEAVPWLELLLEELPETDVVALAQVHNNLAEALCRQNRCADAAPHYEWILDEVEDSLMRTLALSGLGRVALDRGELEQALTRLREARTAVADVPADAAPELLPEIESSLARTLREQGAPVAKWRPLAESAYRNFEALGSRPDALAELEPLLGR